MKNLSSNVDIQGLADAWKLEITNVIKIVLQVFFYVGIPVCAVFLVREIIAMVNEHRAGAGEERNRHIISIIIIIVVIAILATNSVWLPFLGM